MRDRFPNFFKKFWLYTPALIVFAMCFYITFIFNYTWEQFTDDCMHWFFPMFILFFFFNVLFNRFVKPRNNKKDSIWFISLIDWDKSLSDLFLNIFNLFEILSNIFFLIAVFLLLLSFFYFINTSSPVELLITLIFIMIFFLLNLFDQVEFFSIIVLIVYVGAISTLFLFIIMLLVLEDENDPFFRFPLIIFVFLIILFSVFCNLNFENTNIFSNLFIYIYVNENSVFTFFKSDAILLSSNLFSNENLIFLNLIAVILLVVMIGCISLLLSI